MWNVVTAGKSVGWDVEATVAANFATSEITHIVVVNT